MLVALGPAHLHHRRRAQPPSQRLQPPRRPAGAVIGRQSGISTATRRDKGAWSACCKPRPSISCSHQPQTRGRRFMHAYERWILRRYLGNALNTSRLARPPRPSADIVAWVELTPARSECQASPARRQSCGADEGFKSQPVLGRTGRLGAPRPLPPHECGPETIAASASPELAGRRMLPHRGAARHAWIARAFSPIA